MLLPRSCPIMRASPIGQVAGSALRRAVWPREAAVAEGALLVSGMLPVESRYRAPVRRCWRISGLSGERGGP